MHNSLNIKCFQRFSPLPYSIRFVLCPINLQTIARLAREYFYEQRIELRKALRGGSIDNITYQRTLTPLRKKAMEAENQCYEYEREGLNKVFGDDASYFDFKVIEKLILEMI